MKKYWMTQDGTEIEYSKIENSHLLNILKFLKRRAKEGVQNGVCFYDGDNDYMTGDVWMEYGEDVLRRADYYGLEEEAKKRGLVIN